MEGENNNGLLTTTTSTQSIFQQYNSLVSETEETGTTTSRGDRGFKENTLLPYRCVFKGQESYLVSLPGYGRVDIVTRRC